MLLIRGTVGRRVESEGGVWRLLATSGLGPVREGDTAQILMYKVQEHRAHMCPRQNEALAETGCLQKDEELT